MGELLDNTKAEMANLRSGLQKADSRMDDKTVDMQDVEAKVREEMGMKQKQRGDQGKPGQW